jgi:hypothetical protein
MLIVAPNVFGDAMWQARIIAEALCAIEILQPFGRPDIAREHVNATVKLIEDRVREGFGRISEARIPKISSFKIHTALRHFLDKFREAGEVPSQRQFAKALDVTPKAWREFLAKHALGKHELIVKQWLDELLAQDHRLESRLGSINRGDSPQGD